MENRPFSVIMACCLAAVLVLLSSPVLAVVTHLSYRVVENTDIGITVGNVDSSISGADYKQVARKPIHARTHTGYNTHTVLFYSS